MIKFGNFKKVSLHQSLGCYEAYAWTFEFEHDVSLVDLERDEFFVNDQKVELPFPTSRSHCRIAMSKNLDKLRFEATDVLRDLFPKIASEETQYFKSRWMWDPTGLSSGTYTFSDIVRDADGFFLSPHIDNNFVIGNAIMNLVDNDCGTEFHQLGNPNVIEFKAPGQKGTGTFFLNGPGALHSITNNSGRTRYTLATNWHLRKDSSLRNKR